MSSARSTQTPIFLPVSVVIPAYNAAFYITGAIESIRGQTALPAEIVVVDDGSADGTGDIAESLDVVVLRQKNAGVSAARNAGIRKASQPWIAFLDADDRWDSDKLTSQWDLHRAAPEAGILCVDHRQRTADGAVCLESFMNAPHAHYLDLPRQRVGERMSWFPELDERFGAAGMFLFPSCVMAKRSVLMQAGLFAEDMQLAEDVEFFLRVLGCTTLAVLEKPLVSYMVHEDNASRDELVMTLGAIQMTKRVLASPHAYPKGAAARFRSSLHNKYAAAGRMLIDRNELPEGRAMLMRSLRLRFSHRTLALWILSFRKFPFALLEVKRRIKGWQSKWRTRG